MKPHNPMINAGAIACVSLLRPEMKLSDRFDFVLALFYRPYRRHNESFVQILQSFKEYAGNEFMAFDNST